VRSSSEDEGSGLTSLLASHHANSSSISWKICANRSGKWGKAISKSCSTLTHHSIIDRFDQTASYLATTTLTPKRGLASYVTGQHYILFLRNQFQCCSLIDALASSLLDSRLKCCTWLEPCSMVETDRRFRGNCCSDKQWDGGGGIKNLWNVGQFLQDNTALHLQDSHLHPRAVRTWNFNLHSFCVYYRQASFSTLLMPLRKRRWFTGQVFMLI
jgi:hypothetical protein